MAPSTSADPGTIRSWSPPYPLDLRATLAPLGRGAGDPTHRVEPDGTVWHTARTPDGPATLRLRRAAPDADRGGGPIGAAGPAGEVTAGPRRGLVHAQAWGDGAGWLLDAVPDLLGAADDPDGFTAHHGCVADALRRHPGLRLTRTGLVFEQVVPAILEQKVTGIEARRSWRELLWRVGTPAPGPAPAAMRVLPDPDVWRRLPAWEWHRAGVDPARQRAIGAAALVADRLEQAARMSPADAVRRLRAVPGIGAWTAAEVVQRALGAPDEVSVGDFHLPSIVGWSLVGRRLDDAGMLDVLAPYAGHRQRAVRLIELGGVAPPRRGPRYSPRDYRTF